MENNKFPVLFGKSKTGAVLTWEIIVDGDSFYVITGQEDGKLVQSAPNKCEGKNLGKKNETTPESQAIKEAEAKFKKKLKEKYFFNVDEIDKENYFEPMLAKVFKDRLDKVKYPVLVDRKYNGARCIATKDGLFTRKGERWMTVPHIEESLEHLFDLYPEMVLDGELYNHDLRFNLNDMMSLVRKTKNIKPEDLEKSKQIVQYHVYDYVDQSIADFAIKQFDRRTTIKKIIANIPYLYLVDGEICNNEEEVYCIYRKFINEGYEGAMVRLDTPYQNGRSSSLLKLKPEMDSEGEIIDIIEGDGNWAGTGKIIRLKWQGKEFNSTLKGTFEDGVSLLKNKASWIGKIVTFQFNDLTGLGIPNFARVDINNCIKS